MGGVQHISIRASQFKSNLVTVIIIAELVNTMFRILIHFIVLL